MKRFVITTCLIMIAGCSSNRLYEEHQVNELERITVENSRYDMYEVLFRHFFANNGSGLPGPRPLPDYWDIYLSIIDTQYDNEDDMIIGRPETTGVTKSPSKDFIKRFAKDGRKIEAAPEGVEAFMLANQSNTVQEGKTLPKRRIIIFMVEGFVRNNDGTVTIKTKYYVHSMHAGSYRYTMKKENGEWTVLDAQCTGIS